MIHGIGNDIIEVKRIAQAIERHGQRFLDRLFTPQEQAYCLAHIHPEQRFAARFAAKEAIVKAFGTGFRHGLSWLDIEIFHDQNGKPVVKLSQLALGICSAGSVMISMSHCHEYATAVAIVAS